MKLLNHVFTFTMLVLLIKVCPVLSQDISFNKVSLPDETLSRLISGITQDPQGNIWFTCSGLYQFDGIHVKSYVHDPLNPGSVAISYMECVFADREGNIWAGTYGDGLEKFDPNTGVFTHYRHNDKDSTSISGDSITCILQDREGFLWVGDDYRGLNRMDIKTGKFIHYKHRDNDPSSLSFDQVRVIYEDREGVIWVGAGSPFPDEDPDKKGGLNRFNRNTGTFTCYLHNENDPHSLIDNRVRAIFEDSYGSFWVGTAGDGLHTMDRKTGVFERHTFDPAHPEKLSRPSLKNNRFNDPDHITFIREDSQRAIWIGTFENGVIRYDPASKKITHFSAEKDSVGKFTDSATWWAYTSRDGVMWMSIWSGGLYRFDPSHQNIQHTPLNGALISFLEEPDNTRWIGTDAGLLRIDAKNNGTQLFVHDDKKQGSISSNMVFSLYKDRENRLWAATAAGLNLFNPDKQNFTSYKHDPKISSSLIHDVVFCIYEDEQSNLWVGTLRGLDKMNVAKGEFTHYAPFPEDTITNGRNCVIGILEDSAHNLWIGDYNFGGLHQFNRKTGQFKHYLTNRNMTAIYEDRDAKLWAGSEEGLYEHDRATDSFHIFVDPANGSTIAPLAITEDNSKNLWVSTRRSGLYRIDSTRNGVIKFGASFGVNDFGLSAFAAFKDHDGQLIFGDYNGYYSLSPGKIIANLKPPQIALTDFRINDHQLTGANRTLKDISTAKEISLRHDQNFLSLYFNVIHYSNPEANKAMYMLENYDKGWRPAGSEHTAYYYNVPPGHYIFRIRAASSYGVWAEKDISIIIAPPWWSTWWAYCIYSLLLIATVLGIHRFQKARIVRAERERSRAKELAQAKEIEKAYTELKTTQTQLIHQEKMASLGELTGGIAHEIQNPLNFVNNFSELNEELLTEMKNEMSKGKIDDALALANDAIENQKKIIHHGKRADAIVKSMLQHSRASTGKKELTDINALADEYLRLSYHGMRAKDKDFNATLKTDFDPSIEKINVVPQDLGRVLLNLYNNAFYATSEKLKAQSSRLAAPDGQYVPRVTIVTKKLNARPDDPVGRDKIEIIVKDNGPGIPQNIIDKIFQPFFTTKPTGQGTGLGLSLSYDIIKAHGGEIRVETKDGEESAFIIQLPIV